MEQPKSIWYITLLLTCIAGYCDTLTFVAADNLFSAHVTGNFIVFAYQIINGDDINAWVKLLTFPIFIISVMIGGFIASKSTVKYKILFWEGCILLLSGLFAVLFNSLHITNTWSLYFTAMLIVFSMGLQNAFGKLFSKETHGPTTMMTGNVTQASLDIGILLKTKFTDLSSKESFKKQFVTIGGFLTGCFLGAIAGKKWGLIPVLLPGIIMVLCYLKNSHIKTENKL
jgi:uncharacterized membrane protein YoaK (UPF0700 family)